MRKVFVRSGVGALILALVASILILMIPPTLAAPEREFSTVRVRLTSFGTPQSKSFIPTGVYAVDG
ncbi:MAG: hypothetical protein FWD16_06255, partial [Clostridia bacterium]|nr:hypothetical protein [Clostridia bacterium]